MFDHIHSNPTPTVYAAIELSKKTWVIAILRPGKVQPSLHRIKGGSFAELVMRLRAASNDERLLVCYEAGYDGFWLARSAGGGRRRLPRARSRQSSGQPTRTARQDGPDRRVDAGAGLDCD